MFVVNLTDSALAWEMSLATPVGGYLDCDIEIRGYHTVGETIPWPATQTALSSSVHLRFLTVGVTWPAASSLAST